MSRISDFFSGVRHLGKGFRFLFAHPSLWIWVLIPWLLGIVILAISWGLFVHYYPAFYQFLSAHVGLSTLPDAQGFWQTIVHGGLWTFQQILKLFIFLLGLILLSIVSFVVYLIISAPFCDLLAEKVATLSQGVEPPPFEWKHLFKNTLQIIVIESKKAMLFLALPIVLALFNLIPIAGGFLYLVTTLLFGMWGLGFISVDYRMGHQRMSFRERLFVARKNKYALIGFGIPFLIPFAPLLLQAPMVVGGTLLYSTLELPLP